MDEMIVMYITHTVKSSSILVDKQSFLSSLMPSDVKSGNGYRLHQDWTFLITISLACLGHSDGSYSLLIQAKVLKQVFPGRRFVTEMDIRVE